MAALAIAVGFLMAIAGATWIGGPYVLVVAGVILVVAGILIDVDAPV